MSRVRVAIVVLLLAAPSAEAAVVAGKAAVSTPERLATAVGLNVLRDGGTAADAAVAIAFTLAVLRPESAGLLGGGTLLYFDAPSDEIWALDFRPGPANPTYLEGVVPESIAPHAVPGFVRGLSELHRKFGSNSWASLLRPAEALVGEDRDLVRIDAVLEEERASRSIDALVKDSVNAEMAAILSRVATKGAGDVHLGETAKLLVARSRAAGGAITLRALSEYAPRWRSPLRLDFRGDQVFTMATPAGAGSVLAETMTLLSGFDWRERGAGDAGTAHLFVEAERYGWAGTTNALSERDAASRQMRHSAEELAKIRTRIEQSPLDGSSRIRNRAYESSGFVVMDEEGSAVVVSLSLGARFGAGTRLTGTAFIAEVPPESGEEPTLPLLVLRDGRVGLVVNSSGSGREAAIGGGLYLRSRLLKAGLEELISMPRFIPASEPRTIVCERGTDLHMIEDLNAMGHGVEWDDAVGIVHAIEISDRIAAISDPRGGTAGGY